MQQTTTQQTQTQPEKMRLLLIRHAQSANNLLYAETGGTVGRSHDPALTPLGHQQAQALADFARTDPTFQAVTHLYCSLTTRAVQTAAPLAAALGLSVQGLPHAYETGGLFLRDEQGVAYSVPGKTHTELLTENPALLWPAELDPAAAWAGGFEPSDDHPAFMRRAASVLEHLQAAHAAGKSAETGAGTGIVALVTHGHFTQFLLRNLLAHGEAYFQIYNTGTTLVTLPPPGTPDTEASAKKPLPFVDWVNRFDHLNAVQLTQ